MEVGSNLFSQGARSFPLGPAFKYKNRSTVYKRFQHVFTLS
jgi:hypothetical protein